MKTISASDANRYFSRVLRDVAAGEAVTVVARGRPVASIAPIRPRDPAREAAKRRLLDRLHGQDVTGSRDWTRDALYER
ncbi:type II toxin-antitoxin system prevent-host-death family antitoxin [Tepidimonas taiwanensis]|uniref:Prevent-host-death family protein n=1 Tax=Tepidimonas taiwanensis TaxID=307486 RepID=A0A554X6B5_9BURK|nr:type II toxin-antitoxin system prevent-host-death family antitoxin [Tepidimonas taiwanensis]MCX7691938.1 type II toxin-antitoxin system prevent-host-death family antitoxin [Tepidimonas taiwanensis]TSE31363.1 prevent-host-death family protein [Tepidimonas taiwanensis]UBQ06121.1 type II toxin-antitoxin system prevent-host-death family antitoxin [Tepidimonas taiwanensis]